MRSQVLFLYSLLSRFLPPSRFFSLKSRLLRVAGGKIGHNVRVISSACFATSGPLEIGNNTFIGHDVMILGGSALIRIGPDCDVAPRVLIVSGSHTISTIGNKAAGEGYSAPIEIGAGCWICASSTILGDTQIGENSVVAAGSVVKGSFPPYSLIAGNPAKAIKFLREPQITI